MNLFSAKVRKPILQRMFCSLVALTPPSTLFSRISLFGEGPLEGTARFACSNLLPRTVGGARFVLALPPLL